MTTFCSYYDIPPMACPRPRVTRFGTYYPAKYRIWLKHARETLLDVSHLNRIHLVFVLPRPKRLPKNGDRQPHDKKPDLDNLIKSWCDALPFDDKTITSISAQKYYAASYESAHVWMAGHGI